MLTVVAAAAIAGAAQLAIKWTSSIVVVVVVVGEYSIIELRIHVAIVVDLYNSVFHYNVMGSISIFFINLIT